MNHLKRLLKQPLSNVSTSLVVALFVVALLGFADATFLTIEHFRGVIPPCATEGCDLVLSSSYSAIAGIPTSLLGSIYYLIIAIGTFMYLEARYSTGMVSVFRMAVLKWCLLATVIGLLMSLWLLYLQAFVLYSYCLYCLGSALTSIILFVIAGVILKKNENIQNPNN